MLARAQVILFKLCERQQRERYLALRRVIVHVRPLAKRVNPHTCAAPNDVVRQLTRVVFCKGGSNRVRRRTIFSRQVGDAPMHFISLCGEASATCRRISAASRCCDTPPSLPRVMTSCKFSASTPSADARLLPTPPTPCSSAVAT